MQYTSTSEQKVEQFNYILSALDLPSVELPEQMNYTKQETALDSVRRGLYMVGSVNLLGEVSFAANPMVHESAVTARSECKRLANANPGKAFIFVKLAGAELIPSQRGISI